MRYNLKRNRLADEICNTDLLIYLKTKNVMTKRQLILATIERKKGNETDNPDKLSLRQALEKVNEFERTHGYHSEMSYTTLKGYYDCNGGFRPSTEQRLVEGLGLC